MRGVFRSTWFSVLLGLWYALVAMPALPALSFGSAPAPADSACVVVCACVSCSGGDTCCCANKAAARTGKNLDSITVVHAHSDPADEDSSSAWAPLDCAKKASWILGLQIGVVPQPAAPAFGFALPAGTLTLVAEQPRPLSAVGVPEPPPRRIA